MPLIKSKSTEAMAQNIREMMHSFKQTGKIGNSSPKDMAKARKQALAAAFQIKRSSK